MNELVLGLGLLDHQLVDCEGRNCGKVDDLELDLDHPDGPRVTAILSGPLAWRNRGRVGRLAASLCRQPTIKKVSWMEVADVESAVISSDALGNSDSRLSICNSSNCSIASPVVTCEAHPTSWRRGHDRQRP
jgi:hypothetical protein